MLSQERLLVERAPRREYRVVRRTSLPIGTSMHGLGIQPPSGLRMLSRASFSQI